MDLFIDKKNLELFINFVTEKGKEVERYKYVDYLQKFDIYYDFGEDASSKMAGLGEEEEYSEIYEWKKKHLGSTRKREGKDFYKSERTKAHYPKSFSIEDIRVNPQYLSAVYLVEDIEKKGLNQIVLYGKGDNPKVLDYLFLGDGGEYSQIKFIKKYISWNSIIKNIPPCTDIVICDRYFFSPKNGRTICKENIKDLLRSLTQNTKAEINVVILTQLEGLFDFLGVATIDEQEMIDLLDFVKEEAMEANKVKATLVIDVNDRSNQGKFPHDRMIITNYCLWLSGDSFQYFDYKRGSCVSNRYYLVHSSLVDRDNYSFVKDTIEDLNNRYIEKKEEGDFNCLVYGDGTSNLLESLKTLDTSNTDFLPFKKEWFLKGKKW